MSGLGTLMEPVLRSLGGFTYQPVPREFLLTTMGSDFSWTTFMVEEMIPMMREYYVIQLTLFYMISQPILKWVFKDGRFYTEYKGTWKKIMAAYNFVMSGYSLVTFILSLSVVAFYGVWSYSWDTDAPQDTCYAPLMTDKLFLNLVWWFYISKYIEYADTWFLIIAQKPVSTLQYFHHVGAAIDMFVLWKFQNEGVWIFIIFNSLIHTLMYFYFGCTALGIKTPLKVVMTTLQLLQLSVGNTMALRYYWVPCYNKNPYLVFGLTFTAIYVYSLVVLFAQFFYTSYVAKGKKGAKRARSGMMSAPVSGSSTPVSSSPRGADTGPRGERQEKEMMDAVAEGLRRRGRKTD